MSDGLLVNMSNCRLKIPLIHANMLDFVVQEFDKSAMKKFVDELEFPMTYKSKSGQMFTFLDYPEYHYFVKTTCMYYYKYKRQHPWTV